MVESLCGKCAKYILFVFNFIFWLSGGALLGVGIWLLNERELMKQIAALTSQANSAELQLATYILIGTGGAIFIIGFFGCCGAVRESRCLLVIYAMFMFLIIAAEVGAAVVVYFFQNKVENFFLNNLKNEVKQNYKGNSTFRTAWDSIQKQFRCCGVGSGPIDWRETIWFRSEEAQQNGTQIMYAPWTCCRPEFEADGKGAQCQDEARGNGEETEYLYKEGCYDTVLRWVKMNGQLLISVGAGIAALQILGLAFSCFLLYEIKQEKSVGVTA